MSPGAELLNCKYTPLHPPSERKAMVPVSFSSGQGNAELASQSHSSLSEYSASLYYQFFLPVILPCILRAPVTRVKRGKLTIQLGLGRGTRFEGVPVGQRTSAASWVVQGEGRMLELQRPPGLMLRSTSFSSSWPGGFLACNTFCQHAIDIYISKQHIYY